MTDRPILFSGPMVRAILEGRKTQTRRIFPHRTVERPDGFVDVYRGADIDSWIGTFRPGGMFTSPYGEPGDRLWVRETWLLFEHSDVGTTIVYEADGARDSWYDEDIPYGWNPPKQGMRGGRVPGIHMPRWASRITLEVTSVRVERLQAITDADARAEGVMSRLEDLALPLHHVVAFAGLWDEINGKRASWESNPWVWVVGFRRVEP
jgi:hypothetical protein